jgi:hypothetical protein
MVTGFVLLVVYAVLAATARSTTAEVATGALGVVAAAFAGYISRTFVRSQETLANHLRSYFNQPLEFSRFLAAERLLHSIEGLDETQRAAILADLLRTVIAPDAAAAAGPGPSAATITLQPGPPSGAAADGAGPGPQR